MPFVSAFCFCCTFIHSLALLSVLFWAAIEMSGHFSGGGSGRHRLRLRLRLHPGQPLCYFSLSSFSVAHGASGWALVPTLCGRQSQSLTAWPHLSLSCCLFSFSFFPSFLTKVQAGRAGWMSCVWWCDTARRHTHTHFIWRLDVAAVSSYCPTSPTTKLAFPCLTLCSSRVDCSELYESIGGGGGGGVYPLSQCV